MVIAPSAGADPDQHGGLFNDPSAHVTPMLRARVIAHSPARLIAITVRAFGHQAPGRIPVRRAGGMFASTSAVASAGRVTVSSVRSRRRHSDSVSPSGTAAFKRALCCTSGRSMTASTRLARLPGAICPDAACSDARAVPSARAKLSPRQRRPFDYHL